MKRTLAWVWAIVSLVLGLSFLAWIGYNVFIEELPSAKGHNPVVPTVIGLAMVAVGIKRIRRLMPVREKGGVDSR